LKKKNKVLSRIFLLIQDNLDALDCLVLQAWMANLEFKALRETREVMAAMGNPALPDRSALKEIADLTGARVYL
jgi:hypothetical protein